jgi:hypothetical protein
MLYTVDVNDFYAKIGPVETNIPWGRPDFQTLKFFLNYIKNNSDIFERYEIYLIGKVLFNWDTWDVDILIVNDFKNYKEIERDITFIVDTSLNKFGQLIDVQYRKEKSLKNIRTPDERSHYYYYSEEDIKEDREFFKFKIFKKIKNGITYEYIYDGEEVSEHLIRQYTESVGKIYEKNQNIIYHIDASEILDITIEEFNKRTNRINI